MALFAAVILVMAVVSSIVDGRLDAGFLVLIGFLAALIAAAPWAVRLTLSAEAVELRWIAGKRRLQVSEIQGYRTLQGLIGAQRVQLVPAKPRARALELPSNLDLDEHFRQWLGKIPDLDAKNRRQALDELAKDPDLPGSHDDKLARLQQTRWIAKGLSLLTVAMSLALVFRHQLFAFLLVPISVIPVVAMYLAARYGAFYRLNPADGDVRSPLHMLIIFPPLCLFMMCVQIDVLDQSKLLAFAVAAGIFWLALSIGTISELTSNRKSLAIVIGFMLLYSYAALRLVNTYADRGPPVAYTVPVLGNYPSELKLRGECDLGVRSWDGRGEETRIPAGRALCDAMTAGQTLCVEQWSGALGVRWFEMRRCPSN